MRHECHQCSKKADEHKGSWNRDPYLFFCGTRCHEQYLKKNPKKSILDGRAIVIHFHAKPKKKG